MRIAVIAMLATVANLLLIGCVSRQKPMTNWQFRDQVLVPPRPGAGVGITLRNARSRTNGQPCEVTLPQIQLVWRRRTAQIRIRPDVTGGPAAVTVVSASNEQSPGAPLRDLAWWSSFRDTLERREGEGCVGPGDAVRLAGRIIENVEIPSWLAYQLRYGNSGSTGYLDLEPQFAMKWMTPLLKSGVLRYTGPKDIARYETMIYRLKPRSGGGVKLELETVEHNVQGGFTYDRRPTAPPLVLPDSARFLRYFFRTWRATNDRRIALLAVKRRSQLDPLTKRFEADPEGFCRSIPVSEAMCLAVPNESILVPEVEVRANGKPAWVPVGGTLGDALNRAKVKMGKETLQNLTVLRPWSGQLLPIEFDRSRPDILRLVMIGGESIHW